MANKKESEMSSIEIEICQIDRKYESYRMKSTSREKMLLSCISAQGIQEPVGGLVTAEGRYVILDGFKRLRCAEKLGIHQVKFTSLGEDEVEAIFQLMRVANAKSLSMLE